MKSRSTSFVANSTPMSYLAMVQDTRFGMAASSALAKRSTLFALVLISFFFCGWYARSALSIGTTVDLTISTTGAGADFANAPEPVSVENSNGETGGDDASAAANATEIFNPDNLKEDWDAWERIDAVDAAAAAKEDAEADRAFVSKTGWGQQLKNCSELTNKTREATERLLTYAPDHSAATPEDIPEWVRRVCPSVAEHFTLFPYFRNFSTGLPTQTTSYAAHSVCSMAVATAMAASVNTTLMVYAGSHLGAIRHGSPIPWDDDVDMLMPVGSAKALLKKCRESRNILPGLKVRCTVMKNIIKVQVILKGVSHYTKYGWFTPFVDIWMYRETPLKRLQLVDYISGKDARWSYPADQASPLRRYYYGGLMFWGPPESQARKYYNLDVCMVAMWNHRLEDWPTYKGSLDADCCRLRSSYVFMYEDRYLYDGTKLLDTQDDSREWPAAEETLSLVSKSTASSE